MGFTSVQRFFRVDLPLAGPVLLAGIRVVSVSTVSLVSIGALIGNGALGYLFTNGFQRAYPEQVLWGIIAIAVIALVFDLILQLIGRLLMPWRGSSSRPARRRERVVPA
jgi:osmoprotectant transport system permease protein